jgi:hypothetical protein
MGDYKGQIGMSPPAAYPSTGGYEANEGNFKRRHHVYVIIYYSSGGQELSSLSGVLLLEHLPRGRTTNPQEYNDQN